MKVWALIIGLFIATTVWAYEGHKIKLIETGESSGLRQEIYPVHPRRSKAKKPSNFGRSVFFIPLTIKIQGHPARVFWNRKPKL